MRLEDIFLSLTTDDAAAAVSAGATASEGESTNA